MSLLIKKSGLKSNDNTTNNGGFCLPVNAEITYYNMDEK